MTIVTVKGVKFDDETRHGQAKKMILRHPHKPNGWILSRLDWEDTQENRNILNQARTRVRKTLQDISENGQTEVVRKKGKFLRRKVEAQDSQESPFRVQLQLRSEGIELKLRDEEGMFATIGISKEGVTVRRANSKAQDPRTMSWRVLQLMSETGLTLVE